MSKKKINTFIGSIGAFIGVLVFLYTTDYSKYWRCEVSTSAAACSSSFLFVMGNLRINQ